MAATLVNGNVNIATMSDVPNDHPICPKCGYDLYGVEENRCPECGYQFDPEALANIAQQQRWATLSACSRADVFSYAAIGISIAILIAQVMPYGEHVLWVIGFMVWRFAAGSPWSDLPKLPFHGSWLRLWIVLGMIPTFLLLKFNPDLCSFIALGLAVLAFFAAATAGTASLGSELELYGSRWVTWLSEEDRNELDRKRFGAYLRAGIGAFLWLITRISAS